MWIDRNITSRLYEYARLYPAVMVTGLRQSGKTALLTKAFPDAHYVSLDDPAEAARANESPEVFLSSLNAPTIIDEVQYVPALFRHLKLFIDPDKTPGRWLLTGSQPFHLMTGVSESLAGRIGLLELGTLSADELLSSSATYSLDDYLVRGGFPALYSSELPPRVFFPNYIATYLERDVRNIAAVTDLRDFSRFVRAAALRSGSMLSYADLARDVGVAPNTAKSWISILESSGVVRLVEGFYVNKTARIVKSPKLYFMDTGLLCRLIGFESPEELERSAQFGSIWETYCACQIIAYLRNSGRETNRLFYWRTTDGKEVDFVYERGERVVLFECKTKALPDKDDARGFDAFARFHNGRYRIFRRFLCRTPKDYPWPGDGSVLVSSGERPAAAFDEFFSS